MSEQSADPARAEVLAWILGVRDGQAPFADRKQEQMSTRPTHPPVLADADAARLLVAIDAYDADGNRYDEVFIEVGQRITDAERAGKLDLAALITWKRSGQGAWVKKLLATPEALVQEVTRKAFAAEGDEAVLRALGDLPGFASRGPIATVLMAAYNPREWGVLDGRACDALADLGRPVGNQRGKTLRYLATVRGLRDELTGRRPGITARDVDKGLFVMGERPASADGT